MTMHQTTYHSTLFTAQDTEQWSLCGEATLLGPYGTCRPQKAAIGRPSQEIFASASSKTLRAISLGKTQRGPREKKLSKEFESLIYNFSVIFMCASLNKFGAHRTTQRRRGCVSKEKLLEYFIWCICCMSCVLSCSIDTFAEWFPHTAGKQYIVRISINYA
jgi:hypothetical protein